MAAHLPQLDREALKRLRETVRQLQQSPRSALPVRELLDLAGGTPAVGVPVTIDFEASRELGDALIVIRVPVAHDDAAPDPRLMKLTHREREVAALVARGLSNKRIAVQLGIARSTVKDHLHHILRKTGLPNRAAIAAAWRAPFSDV